MLQSSLAVAISKTRICLGMEIAKIMAIERERVVVPHASATTVHRKWDRLNLLAINQVPYSNGIGGIFLPESH